MDSHYAEEKFIQAERALAIGRNAIKGRLYDAYLCFATVTEADIPAEMRDDFRWIIQQLTMRAPLKAKGSDKIISGSISQTLHFMKNKTAQPIAERILSLRYRLKSYNEANNGN